MLHWYLNIFVISDFDADNTDVSEYGAIVMDSCLVNDIAEDLSKALIVQLPHVAVNYQRVRDKCS